MKVKILLMLFLNLLNFDVNAASFRDYFYYSPAENAFDFSTERAVLHEYYIDVINNEAVTDNIILVDFKKKAIKKIASSNKTLAPIAISPTHQFIFFNQDIDNQAVLYDLDNEQIFATKQGDVRLILWNNRTGRFYLNNDNSQISSYEYDFDQKKFVDAPMFQFVTTIDSKGPYRLDFYGSDMASIWFVIDKKSDQKITEFYKTNGSSNQAPLWSGDFRSLWFFPHAMLVNVDKRLTMNFLEDNDWRDISHNDTQVFLYDQDDEVFHVVDAATGSIQKTYEPFWRKTLLKAP